MATFTPNLNLEQQGSTERASLVVLNSNLGKIDTFAGNVETEIADLSSTESIIVSSVNDLQSKLLAKAQGMGSDEIKNIKIIFDAQNESVFTNGNYYCGWIANNSKGTNWLYFSGVLKGLFGADTIEFTYSNGTWSFNKLVASKWEIVTPTIDSTKIVSGSVSCVKRDGIAYVQLYNVVFASSGSLSQCITGLPQAVVGGDGTFIGTSAAATAQISAAGDTWYFDPNTTYLNAIMGSTYGSGHWASFMYPCV